MTYVAFDVTDGTSGSFLRTLAWLIGHNQKGFIFSFHHDDDDDSDDDDV
jgi:hypothetical protein